MSILVPYSMIADLECSQSFMFYCQQDRVRVSSVSRDYSLRMHEKVIVLLEMCVCDMCACTRTCIYYNYASDCTMHVYF